MRAPAVSFAHKIAAATLAALLTFTLVPFAHADGEGIGAEGSEGAFGSRGSEAKQVPLGATSLQPPSDPSTEAADPSVTLSGTAEGGEVEGSDTKPLTLASGLVGTPSNFINSDVALDSEPVIGSFTVDGLTFAVAEGSTVELVGVAGAEGAFGSEVPTSPQPPSAPTPEAVNLVLPETVAYEGSEYTLASIAPYALYLSGVTDVTLPASVSDVDDRAFRSSDVASVTVAEGNPAYSSSDGALYDADQLSLLLIPEGKQGTVRIPKTAEVAEASVFSHCPLADSISVDAGSAAFASENGLLYTSDLTTLLRVPAGATEITIREGCTTIAAGAMEACANLTTINAPATVTSISPDVFHAIPTVSLPAASVILSEAAEGGEAEEPNENQASKVGDQLTAMVALSSTDDDLLEVRPFAIEVELPEGVDTAVWQHREFLINETSFEDNGQPVEAALERELQTSETYAAGTYTLIVYSGSYGGTISGSEAGSGNPLTITGVTRFTAYGPSSAGRGSLQYLKNGSLYQVTAARGSSVSLIGWNVMGVGWARDSGDVTMQSPQNSMEVTVAAIWSDFTYRVNYNLNGGIQNYWNGWAYHPGERITFATPTKLGYDFGGWYNNAALSGSRIESVTSVAGGSLSLWAKWIPKTYQLSYSLDNGSWVGPIPARDTYTIETPTFVLPSVERKGYAFSGWSGTGLTGSANKTVTIANGSTGNRSYTAHWTPNSYTVQYRNKADTATLSTDAGFKYDTARALAAKPTSGVSAGYTAVGWATAKDQSSATYAFGSSQKNLATSGTRKLYLAEKANPYAIAFDSQGGPEVPSIGATYDQDVTLPAPGARNGYRFLGWNTEADGSGTAYQVGVALAKPNLATSGEAKLFAQWDAVISAVVPLEVQAQVDVLGLEAPKEAQGCIESRCGEPLKVAEVKLAPLDGATELFGASNVADVFLEVLAEGSTSPDARFSLGSSATESDASKLQAFTMASYGTRMPISYRFAMPSDVQTSLLEHADPKPVCTVAYTVALA